MTDDQLLSALQAEYLQLQKTIEDFDSRALTIKAWSVSFSLVAIIGAFTAHAASILPIAGGSAALFWLIEATWKRFQYAYYRRSRTIEAHFRGELRVEFPFQIGTSWSQMWNAGGVSRMTRIFFWPQVALPHAVVIVVAITLYSLHFAGYLKV